MRKNGVPIEYRYPPVTDQEIAAVADAYRRLTGRQVWPKMLGSFIVLMRTFGPDLVPMMERDIEEHGVKDMLLRLRAAAAPTSTPVGDRMPTSRPPTPSPDDRIKEVNALLTGLRIGDLPDGLLADRRSTTGMTEPDRIRAAAERIRTMEPDAYDDLVDRLAALKWEREAS
jgi:hypothetical protein